MLEILNKVLDFLFPPVCGICGKTNKYYICQKCYNILKTKMIAQKKITNSKEYFYDEMLYIFKYEGIIREKIILYKFKEKSYLSRMFYEIFINNKNCYEFLKNYDIIIPVPIHKKRKKQRGYNQCELIARQLAQFLKKELCTDVLLKTKNVVPQSSLGKLERIENVKGVYDIQNKYKIKNKKILLLDDIFTTGSTVNECSKILKNAGAIKIGVLTIAKD